MANHVWKGHIAFGMVSFPVKLCAAARRQTVSFHHLHAGDLSRVKQVLYCQAEDKPVARQELVKGYEYQKHRYVVVEDHDLQRLAPPSSRTMELLEFVPLAEIDPVYLDASYYVLPEVAGERPYTLLFEVLRRTGSVGLAQWTLQHREHLAVLRPGRLGLLLHTLYYRDEIRAVEEFRADTSRIATQELELATRLVQALAGSFAPAQFKDRYRENLRALIDAKLQGQEPAERVPGPAWAPVVDLLEALKASLARKKQPSGAQQNQRRCEPQAAMARRRRAAAG